MIRKRPDLNRLVCWLEIFTWLMQQVWLWKWDVRWTNAYNLFQFQDEILDLRINIGFKLWQDAASIAHRVILKLLEDCKIGPTEGAAIAVILQLCTSSLKLSAVIEASLSKYLVYVVWVFHKFPSLCFIGGGWGFKKPSPVAHGLLEQMCSWN